jgi:hypothetical protein
MTGVSGGASALNDVFMVSVYLQQQRHTVEIMALHWPADDHGYEPVHTLRQYFTERSSSSLAAFLTNASSHDGEQVMPRQRATQGVRTRC